MKKKCHNCRFAGPRFTIRGVTHMHCQNEEKYPPSDIQAGKVSPWETLCKFSDTCEKHEPKHINISKNE